MFVGQDSSSKGGSVISSPSYKHDSGFGLSVIGFEFVVIFNSVANEFSIFFNNIGVFIRVTSNGEISFSFYLGSVDL
jgi:hypothetical protein